jgi:uncharacterized protein (TIGR02757 family)
LSATADPLVVAPHLARLLARFDRSSLSPDPLNAAIPYCADRGDCETACLIAACFAYGRADLIERTVTSILATMTPTPATFVDAFEPSAMRGWMKGFVYRFHRRADLVGLIRAIGRCRADYGGIKELFLACDDPGAETILPGLSGMARALRGYAGKCGPSFAHLLPDPADGAACKRMVLFMRWMVRKDEVDPGPWSGSVDPARLVMPVDVHVGRIARRLGLLTRKADDWQAAVELTRYLKQFDATDPVRYDFALCSYGKLGYCVKETDPTRCGSCEFAPLCAGR